MSDRKDGEESMQRNETALAERQIIMCQKNIEK